MNHGDEGYATDMPIIPYIQCPSCASWGSDLGCMLHASCLSANRYQPREPHPKGRKDDAEKPRYDLLPFDALDPVVRVLTSGAKRYGDENWRKVEHAPRRYLAAALRHVTAWAAGRENDVDTGESHLAHAVCCLLFLLALQAKPPTAPTEDPR